MDAPRQRSGGARASSAASTWLSARRSASGTRAGCRRRACAPCRGPRPPGRGAGPGAALAFIRLAGTVHTRPARSVSSHDASAGRALPSVLHSRSCVCPCRSGLLVPLPRTARQRQARTARGDFSRRPAGQRGGLTYQPPLCAIWAVFRRSSVQRGRWLPSSQATRSSISCCRRSNKSELASVAATRSPTRCASAARRGAWDWPWGRLAWPWSAFRGAARVRKPSRRSSGGVQSRFPALSTGRWRPRRSARSTRSHGPTTARLFSAAEPR